MQIAIPSFERPYILKSCTLSVLETLNTQINITIFLSNEQEKEKYIHVISPKYNIVVSNTSGLKDKRNFILNYYPNGTHLIQLDDDISNIVQLTHDNKAIGLSDFDTFCKNMFDITIQHNTKLFGVYPLSNPYFMNPYTWVGLSYCVGAFFGIIVDHDNQITNCLQEDKERSLMYYEKYGSIIRCNWVGIHTKYWTNNGGMQSMNQCDQDKRTIDNIQRSITELKSMYPTLVKDKMKKHNIPDVSIKKIITHKYSQLLH